MERVKLGDDETRVVDPSTDGLNHKIVATGKTVAMINQVMMESSKRKRRGQFYNL